MALVSHGSIPTKAQTFTRLGIDQTRIENPGNIGSKELNAKYKREKIIKVEIDSQTSGLLIYVLDLKVGVVFYSDWKSYMVTEYRVLMHVEL